MPINDLLANLPLTVEGYSLERLEQSVATGFTRATTTVVMHGDGHEGRGEDVTYTAEDHNGFPDSLPLAGSDSLAELSQRLESRDLFAAPPAQEAAARDYRRWAFESAALDLALRQSGQSLAQALGREVRPVRFVASTRAAIEGWVASDPTLQFKLDPTSPGTTS